MTKGVREQEFVKICHVTVKISGFNYRFFFLPLALNKKLSKNKVMKAVIILRVARVLHTQRNLRKRVDIIESIKKITFVVIYLDYLLFFLFSQ